MTEEKHSDPSSTTLVSFCLCNYILYGDFVYIWHFNRCTLLDSASTCSFCGICWDTVTVLNLTVVILKTVLVQSFLWFYAIFADYISETVMDS